MTRKILLINDMPGYGKVAIQAMTPVLVHRGYEVFNLPTAILSNTLNYGKFASLDTTSYMREAVQVWEELGMKFDAVSTGFIANDAQAEFIADFLKQQSKAGALVCADPIMGDNGKLYNSITPHRVDIMKQIISVADVIVPNMTEACALAGCIYRSEGFMQEELYEIAQKLHKTGAGSVAITSAGIREGSGNLTKAVIGYDGQKKTCFTVPFEEIPVKINGSGDTFSAIMLADILSGTGFEEAVRHASEGVRRLILKNLEIAGEYNGLPIEAGLSLL